MQITYDPDLYNFSDGRFLAQFQGISVYVPRADKDRWGNPSKPGYLWGFKLLSGPDTGKVNSVLTGQYPTSRNACGRMLQAVTNISLNDKVTAELSDYAGYYYIVIIKENYVSDSLPPVFVSSEHPSPELLKALLNTPPAPAGLVQHSGEDKDTIVF